MEDVLLSLDKRFVAGYVRGEKVEICFVLSRTPLRIFHQGLEAAAQISPLMLFPPATLPEVPLRPPRGGPEGAFINEIIKKSRAMCDAKPMSATRDGMFVDGDGTGSEQCAVCKRAPRGPDLPAWT
eukprot:9469644-Pyramimonas_sp.AAC.1